VSADQLFEPEEFYCRQTVLAELGREGQERLRRSSAVVVGLGGLGTISAIYLSRAGVGNIRLIDQDTVELRNLHRQVLYSLSDLRYPKVEVAAKRIRQANPDVKVEPVPENVRESNVDGLISGADCIVDGLDNMRTRYLLNRASVKHEIPYVFGAAIGIEGNPISFLPAGNSMSGMRPAQSGRQIHADVRRAGGARRHAGHNRVVAGHGGH